MFASLLLYHCITHDCLAMMIKLGMTGRKWNISQSATPVSADQRCANVSADQRHQLCNLLKWGQCSSPRAAKNPITHQFVTDQYYNPLQKISLRKKGYRLGVPLRYITPEKIFKRAKMVFWGQKNCSHQTDQGCIFPLFTNQNLRIWGEYWINIWKYKWSNECTLYKLNW